MDIEKLREINRSTTESTCQWFRDMPVHPGGTPEEHAEAIARTIRSIEDSARKNMAAMEQAYAMMDEDEHIWLPHPSEPAAEVCWRCRCLKMHGTGGRIKYRSGFIPFLLKDHPPSPCRRNRKSDCPI